MWWLIMSHRIKIYAVWKFSYFHLWYLKSLDIYVQSHGMFLYSCGEPVVVEVCVPVCGGGGGGGEGGERGMWRLSS